MNSLKNDVHEQLAKALDEDAQTAQLERKPESEKVTPPIDFKTWEQQRLFNRGLSHKIKKR